MLLVDPAARCSAKEIRSHPWVIGDPTSQVQTNVVRMMRAYNAERRFKVRCAHTSRERLWGQRNSCMQCLLQIASFRRYTSHCRSEVLLCLQRQASPLPQHLPPLPTTSSTPRQARPHPPPPLDPQLQRSQLIKVPLTDARVASASSSKSKKHPLAWPPQTPRKHRGHQRHRCTSPGDLQR